MPRVINEASGAAGKSFWAKIDYCLKNKFKCDKLRGEAPQALTAFYPNFNIVKVGGGRKFCGSKICALAALAAQSAREQMFAPARRPDYRRKLNMKYNKNQTLGEILSADEENATILLGFGMHCLGCPMSQMETLEEACAVHGLDLDFVLDRLNGKA